MSAQEHSQPFRQTATHATEAVATEAAATGKTHYVTDISGSSDKAGAVISVKDGTTVIWQGIVNAGHFNHTFNTPLRCTTGALASVTVDGTSLCKANIAGFTL